MSKKFECMSEEDARSEYKKRQRRLIPANIVVIIIALAAIFCQFTMPMLDVSATIDKSMAPIFSQAMSSAGGESVQDGDELSEYLMEEVNSTVSIKINAADCFALGMSPDGAQVREYLKQSISQLDSVLDEIMRAIMPRFMAYVVATSAEKTVGSIADVPVDDIEAVIALLDEGEYDAAKAQFGAAAEAYAARLGVGLTEDQLTGISDFFSQIVDAGVTEGGSFSYMQALTAVSGEEEGAPEVDIIDEALAELTDEDLALAGTGLFLGSAVFIAFTSILWAIMALIAFIRIFLSNKRFTMWYVKLFCWLPCAIFVLAPTIALAIAPGMIAASGAASAAQAVLSVPLAFGGSGIASGICLALLWIVSIFWLHPIKKGIRKLKKLI